MKWQGFRRNGLSVMASAANASGQRSGRSVDWIEWVGRVISRRAVATLTLDARKVRGCALTHKSGRQPVPHCMTGQAACLFVGLNRLERLKGARMRRILHFSVNVPVALRAGCSTGVGR